MQVARFSIVAVLVGLVTTACGGEEGATTPPPSTAATGGTGTTAPPPPPPAEARARWEEAGFELGSSTTGTLQAGQEGHIEIRLAARGNYHVNQDYPISIQVTAPDGVTLPHATLARADAAEFSETVARFDVPFTAPAGHHELRALVDFAVCTPESCMPDTRTLAIALDVP
jgi:hypothetical protein